MTTISSSNALSISSLPTKPIYTISTETEFSSTQAADEQQNESTPEEAVTDRLWATLHIGDLDVQIYESGAVSWVDYPDAIQIDWENLDGPAERADAIMAKYGGELTVAELESGEKSLNSEMASKMFESGLLGGGAEDGLLETLQDNV